MFGWRLIRKEHLSDLEEYHQLASRFSEASRYFSGWRDLDIIWEFISGRKRRYIVDVRREYAQLRGTDEYGKAPAQANTTREET